ncbi:SIS domain-containing protein [SAR86 cluster bacterium]|nr:SIS domain-containing protein [SAR86 cluster bacterium]|tara:strand:+ start:2053 stop:2616 length:564 start_codon:yes stop_codon:yes gene_type:complete
MDNIFLKQYLNDFTSCLNQDEGNLDKLVELKNRILETNSNSGKVIIVGNGGSAAISSHFSVDLTKNANVRALNFNEADLITCFSNDYGFENWISKAIEFYSDPEDLIILISSSGKSLNMINAADTAKGLGIKNIVTFTGFLKDNPLSNKGNINFWVNSKAYNFIENIHQIWLLSIVDLIIGDKYYKA